MAGRIRKINPKIKQKFDGETAKILPALLMIGAIISCCKPHKFALPFDSPDSGAFFYIKISPFN
jgi:hypothetical protein